MVLAKHVLITHHDVNITSDGFTTKENFLLVEITKPAAINEIRFNKRIFEDRCEYIKRYLLDSVVWDNNLKFDELRLKFIYSEGFSFIKKEESETIVYNQK